MIFHLRELYEEGTHNMHFSAVCDLSRTKMVKEASIHQHRLTMIGLIEQLESLDNPLDNNLATDIFLASLFYSFSQFVINYNMGKMEHTLSELLNMCVTTKKTFKKEGGKWTIVVFKKGSTSSAKPNQKGKGKFKANKKKKGNLVLKPKGGIKKK
ncbi:uncharacterized protein LOC110770821 [Prunus avium]|uniref:Uncharacterized protein LOC110770821 n=1 Tax=Prunus avium TaxID=42229 RepID=A0A6P5TUN5_PRUAV|nr:uncharacterized protein LOC110770821 [Prunus avium]